MDYESLAYTELMGGDDDESIPVDEDAPVAELFDNPHELDLDDEGTVLTERKIPVTEGGPREGHQRR